MKNKKDLLNIGLIVLAVLIMLGVNIGFSIFADVNYFGTYSILKVLTYGASMLFLYSVLVNKKIKETASSLIVLFFLAGIIPSFGRIKTFFSLFIGSFNGAKMPTEFAADLKWPAAVIVTLQSLFFIMLILIFVFSIYVIFKNKKYNFKEIIIMFILIGVSFFIIEIVENIYVVMYVLKSGFSIKLLLARTPIMVFQYFVVVYLSNNLKNAKDLNLFYYIVFFAYSFVIGINTISSAMGTNSNFVYTLFLIMASILVSLYCLVISFKIYKD